MVRLRAILCLLVLLLVSALVGWAVVRPGRDDFDLDHYQPHQVLDRFSPHINIATKRAAEIAEEVTGDELVLGVEIHGEARAYPINQLSQPKREVFNETLAGRAIAVTWCDRCNNGAVF